MDLLLPTPASIRLIARSIHLEVTHLLPVMLVTHTIILRLEDLSLLLETIAITLRRRLAGAT
jgi:hypothetical protein